LTRTPEKVLVVITIDTECDHDPRWAKASPVTYRSVTEGIPERLAPVFRATGAVPTYLLTVEVMEDEASVHALKRIDHAHELGTHLHAAFVEPGRKHAAYDGVDSPDMQRHLPAELEAAKLATLTGLFERRFGRKPTSFRAGRFGAGENTLPALQRLGYLVDTSVTPHARWPHEEGDVDYRRAPEQPYFPGAGSLTTRAKRERLRVLEVPVTTRPRWLRFPRWFRPWLSDVAGMKRVARYQLERHAGARVLVLNMMFHSMEVIEGATPYPQSFADVQRYLEQLAGALDWCRREGFQFRPLSQLHAEFQHAA
jgi:hypothetical protein